MFTLAPFAWLGQINEPGVRGLWNLTRKQGVKDQRGENFPQVELFPYKSFCDFFFKVTSMTCEVVEKESQNDKLLIMPRDPFSLSWWCFLNMSGSFLRQANDIMLIYYISYTYLSLETYHTLSLDSFTT